MHLQYLLCQYLSKSVMTEVERRMAVKPANPEPIVKTGEVRMDKAKMETSSANTPEYTQQEDSKNSDNIQSELMAEIEMSVAKTPESDIDGMAKFKLHGGEDSGKAETRSKVMDELELSVAKMPTNVGSITAKLTAKMQTGDENGTAEQESEVRKVTDEMEMMVEKLHENDRDKAELRPLGGGESGTAEPENQVTDEMELS